MNLILMYMCITELYDFFILKVVYFVNSGSEANDLALLMARMYTGRYDILSMRRVSDYR